MSLDMYDERQERQVSARIPFANVQYKGKQKGDTIVVIPVKSLIQPYRSLRRPVLGEDGKETTALQNLSGWITSQRGDSDADPKHGMLRWDDLPTRPEAERNMLELYNLALKEYRAYLLEEKINKAKTESGLNKDAALKSVNKIEFKTGTSGYWTLDSQAFGTIVLIGNDIVPFPFKNSTYDPQAILSLRFKETPQDRMAKLMKGEFTPKTADEVVQLAEKLVGESYKKYADLAKNKTAEEALAGLSVNEAVKVLEYSNRGVKQFFDEIHEVDGKKYYKYPKGLTTITLLARDSKKLMFGKPYVIWVPSVYVHQDYQTMIPYEYGFYIFVHPDDVDAFRAYRNLPREVRQKTATPRVREYPDAEGNLVYISYNNPDLPPIKVNVLEGPAGEIYSQAIVDKWQAFPEYHAFRHSNQTTLLGGVFFDVPEVEYEIESRIEKNPVKVKAVADPRRIYPTQDEVREAEIVVNPKGEPVIWYNLDGTLAKDEASRNPVGGWAVLKWTNGLLWDRPLNIDRYGENMKPVLGSDNVIVKIKEHAERLGIPYRGKDTPPLYAWLSGHPLHEKMVKYHRTQVNKSGRSQDNTDSADEGQADEEIPAPDKRGAKIDV